MQEITKQETVESHPVTTNNVVDYLFMLGGVAAGLATFFAVLAAMGSLFAGELAAGFIFYPAIAVCTGGLLALFARLDGNVR